MKIFTKLFKTIFLSTLFLTKSISPYIANIRIFRNPETNKVIVMLGDLHNQGTKEENNKQFEKFKKILAPLRTNKIPTQILFEDRFFYSLYDTTAMIDDKTEGKSSAIDEILKGKRAIFDMIYSLNSILFYATQNIDDFSINDPTWITRIAQYALRSKDNFFKYKSIDPRTIFCGAATSSSHGNMLDMAMFLIANFHKTSSKHKRKIFPDSLINTELDNILNKIQNSMYKYHTPLVSALLKIKSRDAYAEFFKNNITSPFFSRTLEYDAMINMCHEHNYEYTFLISGAKHTHYLAQFMEELGYKEVVNEFGIHMKNISNKALKKYVENTLKEMASERIEKNKVKYYNSLPKQLEQQMNKAFDYIYEMIEVEADPMEIEK